ncbi:glycosyl hydrolase family 65 protein [Mesomycoplasma hyorhinis]|uniref:Glycoside hydrolase family 65 protein n=1 Tax=Mesomycoplasma hyorhinis TaxID=2100 RepID=A0ABD6IEU5_MESHY|nr:glycosyl hydrolase family 65 protein [Mesomycoplasma hyorhinis]ADM21655.1 Putative maltose phosphorylase domain protein [Mesomycoplasma hyorhinis HUB-1]MXR06830.1 glycoside hydrolase family 65 protein [Mesomycoplasma hyorhinis]MXR08308.1 glycoside hydrolase family 65 protein [Mesomycoplasma hyorhinis]MXR08656.1 glycoside hydrolase family 65 protein [Mesomycoplasma hyorhinis]MXR11886.1 glycoside hydrolase family 65 protein [Mesomycoplasma hyorhinis]
MSYLNYDLDNKRVSQVKFNKALTAKTESIFSLANGHMGIRSADEERTSYNKEGFYVNGIFNQDTKFDVPELVNLADLMSTPIIIESEEFEVKTEDKYNKTLWIRDGFLERNLEIRRKYGKFLLHFERFVSHDDRYVYAQKIEIKVEQTTNNQEVEIILKPAINAQVTNTGTQHFGEGFKTRPTTESIQMEQQTTFSKRWVIHNLISKLYLNGQQIKGGNDNYIVEMKRRYLGFKIKLKVKPGDVIVLEKLMSVHSSVDGKHSLLDKQQVKQRADEKHQLLLNSRYKTLKKASIEKMHQRVWNQFFVQIEGQDQQSKYDLLALDFAIFHLNGFVPRHSTNMNVGAKGLSGEGYQGHTYWDTEFFINPIYLFNEPKIVKNLLTYRYKGIKGARAKAKEVKERQQESNLEGAQFPWEMAWPTDGEVCPYWGQADVVSGKQVPIASRRQEIHVSADIAYAVNQYYQISKDEEFMNKMGYEMIIDTAIFYSNRAELQLDGSFAILDVMGPNEYKGNIDNNAYINMFAKQNIDLALKYIKLLKKNKVKIWEKIKQKIPYPINEKKLKLVSKKLIQQQPNKDLIIAENDQFLKLDKIDVRPFQMLGDAGKKLFSTKEGHKRLASQLVKQADVVLLLNLLPHLYNEEIRRKNFNYYEEITTHDSSLSPATYTIEAARLKMVEKAYQLFKYGINIDLGPQMNTSDAGIHAGSLAAIYQMIVFGFGGLDWHDDKLFLDPILPSAWDKLVYRFLYQNCLFEVSVNKENFSIKNISQKEFKGFIYINKVPTTVEKQAKTFEVKYD